MVTSVNALHQEAGERALSTSRPRLIPQDLQVPRRRDTVEFGTQGRVSTQEAMNMVVERAMDRLRAVVTQAREELGLPENAILDTSPEATAQRIADFALGFFSKYAEQHGLEDNEEGRKQYADFIGAAIGQGIAEARDILTALSALNPEVNNQIDETASIISQRLEDFIANGLS